jgi:hypothetical protein
LTLAREKIGRALVAKGMIKPGALKRRRSSFGLAEIAQNLEEDLKRTGFSGRTVVVKYKVSDGG